MCVIMLVFPLIWQSYLVDKDRQQVPPDILHAGQRPLPDCHQRGASTARVFLVLPAGPTVWDPECGGVLPAGAGAPHQPIGVAKHHPL